MLKYSTLIDLYHFLERYLKMDFLYFKEMYWYENSLQIMWRERNIRLELSRIIQTSDIF